MKDSHACARDSATPEAQREGLVALKEAPGCGEAIKHVSDLNLRLLYGAEMRPRY